MKISTEQMLYDAFAGAVLERPYTKYAPSLRIPKADAYRAMGAPSNPPSDDQVSLLGRSIDLQDPFMVQYVLNAGANPNRPDPLFNSAGVLPLSRAIEILCNVVDKAIFNRGLESTLANAKEDIDLISLSNAAIIIRRLGEHGADPDLRLGDSIETPAMLLEYKLGNKHRRAVLDEAGLPIILVKPAPKSAAQGFRDANPRQVSQQPQPGNNSTD